MTVRGRQREVPKKAIHMYWPDGDLWICRTFGVGVQHGELSEDPWRRRADPPPTQPRGVLSQGGQGDGGGDG